MKNFMMLFVAALVVGACVSTLATAQTTNFTDGTSGNSDWADAGNWDNGMPTFNGSGPRTANIDGSFTIDGLGAHKNPGFVAIGYGQWGTINLSRGTLNVSRGVTINNESNGTSFLNVGGGSGPAALNVTATTTTGSSYHGGYPLLMIGTRNNNAATVSLQDNGGIALRVPTANTHSWNHLFVGALANTDNANGTFNLGGGVLDVGSRSIVIGDHANNSFNFTGGRLENLDSYRRATRVGNINNFNWEDYPAIATLNQQGGVLAPGTVTEAGGIYTTDPIGTTTIFGDYNADATSMLEIDINSTGYDQVLVELLASLGGGNATFDGGVDVSLLDGYEPEPGEFFDILVADTALTIADIDNLAIAGDGDWDASLEGGNTLRLTASSTAVPEPSTFALALLGFVGLVFCFRNRQ